jgi:superfamily II DNA or RNA helicase
MECGKDYEKHLDETLTYVIPPYNPMGVPEVLSNMARIRPGLVSIPVGRTDLIPEGYEIVDKRQEVSVDFPKFTGTLRPSQLIAYDQVDGNAVINAWVSWGKTFTALAIAAKLKQKTLVIVHTVPLRNQWAKEAEKVFGISPSIIGSSRLETEGPIVIGNVQTLYRNSDIVRKNFGTVILDEVHHVPAKTFSSLIDASHAKNKIGLSATLQRKDGKHVVIRDYFGNNVIMPPKENYMTPEVHVIKTDIRFMDGQGIPWATKITNLCDKEEYQHLISMLAAAYAAKGHKVLVVGGRVSFLRKCSEMVGDNSICITGRITDHEERERLIDQVRHGEKNVLFGTQSIFSEGISVDPLSCLILANPIGNNEPLLAQLIGRVIRKVPGKLKPVVVDIHFIGNTARRQASYRMGHYMKQGYSITQL